MGVDVSVNGPTTLKNTISKWVWFESEVALEEGEAVCYNWDYTGDGATYSDARRRNNVETPSTTNAQHFAGVAARAYSAKTGGRLIEIYVPGSVCNIRLGSATDTTIGVGLLTFDVTAAYVGQFRYEGLGGEGSAQPLQTIANDGSTATCLAKLQTGPPSGGVEVVQIVDDTAWVAMVGGTTLIIGAVCGGGAAEETIVDGTIEGLRKKVEVITTAVTGNEAIVNVAGGDGITLAGGALATLTLGAIGDQVVLDWAGACWRNAASVGVAEG